jgi:predicted glycosyltransferase
MAGWSTDPDRYRGACMRIWVDLTNSPHVLVLRPVIERLRAGGHDVRVTARDFAQTIELCERLHVSHTAIGRHRGGRLASKAAGLLSRSAALARWARADARAHGGSGFDIAIGHGSNDVTVAAALLRIPSATMFDYEWATVQHNVNCRLAAAVVVPAAIPRERLARYGAAGKLRPYEGLKEEYYLADFEPDSGVLAELALDPARPIVIVRTPPEVSLYHRFANDLFARVLERLARAAGEGVQPVVLPRVGSQRAELARVPGFLVPEQAIDAQSLIAHADLVISAGGTMNREAVALGTPVYSTFEGRLGAVDERLIAEGRLRKLRDPDELALSKRLGARSNERVRRDPQILVDLLLGAVRAGNGMSQSG